jgi:hypothetical protein
MNISVYENGNEVPLINYSECEIDSIIRQINAGWKPLNVVVNVCVPCLRLHVASSDPIPTSLLNVQVPISLRVDEPKTNQSIVFTLDS